MSDYDDTHAQLAEYLRIHPDATAIEAVAKADVDPSVWLDVLEDALATDTPADALERPGEERIGGPTDPADTPLEADGRTDTEDPDKSPEDETPTLEAEGSGSSTPSFDVWTDADFSTTEPDTYPPELLEREQWMGRLEGAKLPFAPWGDRDHPDADAGDDARYKWGIRDMYADGDTVALAEDDPRLGGRVFIQREDDPYAFVDGDDVRDPDTGEVHPAFIALLEHLGTTYADASTSGSGVHAYYKGELPIDGKGQATFEIDTEPWGANDNAPTVEIYANKHVNVTTGEHVRGTPLDVTEWDADTLRTILQANGYQDKEPIAHDTDRDRRELEEHDPAATTADDTAEDVRDILKAVDRLTPADLPLRTRRTGEDSTGWGTWDPSYRSSESGESLHYNGEGAFHDHKAGEAFGVLSLFAAEEGIIRDPWDRLEGAEWWNAVDAARDAGAPIPKVPDGGIVEHTTILPPSVRDLTSATSGWDWEHAGRTAGRGLSIDDARERTTAAIVDAIEGRGEVLVEAVPTMGKSYGTIGAAERTGDPITVVTGRGRKEQYEQYQEWCEARGLEYKVLPSFTRDCPTATGEHGEEWADTVRGWYARGATPKEIHKSAEYVLDRPLPCQEHDGHTCPYAAKWDFDADEYDVLIGHYAHAYKSKVTGGRAVVFDEYPGGAYETTLGIDLQASVSRWLKTTDAVPFESYTDLLENRSDESRRADALLWFDEHGIEPDERDVFNDESAHAAAPLAVFTLLAGDDLGNGFEQARIPNFGVGVFNRANGEVSILQPPDLRYTAATIALDGTPTKRLWDLSLGEKLDHRPVLEDDERAEYIRDALNLNIVRTTEHVKPYNSKDHVNADGDGALLEAIAEEHTERPGVITTTTAEHEYDAAGILEYVDETKHYGNVLGSNRFKEKRLGAVIGSNHYGDGFIQKWGAYAGVAVERGEGRGADLSYGSFGDKVLTHMREHDTLQAVMRFGRDGNGAVVYVHTNTLPEWVPVAGEGRVVKTWSDGMRSVLTALEDLGGATTAAIVEHPAVDVSRRQVFEHLEELRDRGVLRREQDTEDGRRVRWIDDGIHRIGDHGDVSIDPVELEALAEAEVAELSRNSIYTWDFRNLPAEDAGQRGATTTEDGSGADRARADGGDPPDPPE